MIAMAPRSGNFLDYRMQRTVDAVPEKIGFESLFDTDGLGMLVSLGITLESVSEKNLLKILQTKEMVHMNHCISPIRK